MKIIVEDQTHQKANLTFWHDDPSSMAARVDITINGREININVIRIEDDPIIVKVI